MLKCLRLRKTYRKQRRQPCDDGIIRNIHLNNKSHEHVEPIIIIRTISTYPNANAYRYAPITFLLYRPLNASINEILDPHIPPTIAHVTAQAVRMTMSPMTHHRRHAHATRHVSITIQILTIHPRHHLTLRRLIHLLTCLARMLVRHILTRLRIIMIIVRIWTPILIYILTQRRVVRIAGRSMSLHLTIVGGICRTACRVPRPTL